MFVVYLQDMSYLCCLELTGKQDYLLEGLSHLTHSQTGTLNSFWLLSTKALHIIKYLVFCSLPQTSHKSYHILENSTSTFALSWNLKKNSSLLICDHLAAACLAYVLTVLVCLSICLCVHLPVNDWTLTISNSHILIIRSMKFNIQLCSNQDFPSMMVFVIDKFTVVFVNNAYKLHEYRSYMHRRLLNGVIYQCANF